MVGRHGVVLIFRGAGPFDSMYILLCLRVGRLGHMICLGFAFSFPRAGSRSKKRK